MKLHKNSVSIIENDWFRICFLSSSFFKIFAMYLKHLKIQLLQIYSEDTDISFLDICELKRDCV